MKLTVEFGIPQNASSWVKYVNRSLRRQDTFNKVCALIAVTMVAYAFNQDTRIARLEKELEELKYQTEDVC